MCVYAISISIGWVSFCSLSILNHTTRRWFWSSHHPNSILLIMISISYCHHSRVILLLVFLVFALVFSQFYLIIFPFSIVWFRPPSLRFCQLLFRFLLLLFIKNIVFGIFFRNLHLKSNCQRICKKVALSGRLNRLWQGFSHSFAFI